MRSYAVIGMGAVGGLYGGRLAAHGHDVHFLVRSDAADLRNRGLRVRAEDGDLYVAAPSIFDDPAEIPDVDVVVVALKSTSNGDLATILPEVTNPDTAVLLLQNGLGAENEIAKILGTNPILGGLAFVCANKVAPGEVEHLDFGSLTLAAFAHDDAAVNTDIVAAIVADFARTGIKTSHHADLELARWKKLLWNIPYNGLSVVLDAGTDDLMADPATRSLVEDLMSEVQAGALACGREINDAFLAKMLADTDQMTPYRTSMKLDYDAGRPLEVDAIYKAPLEAAARHGCEMARVESLHQQLLFLDGRRRRTVGG